MSDGWLRPRLLGVAAVVASSGGECGQRRPSRPVSLGLAGFSAAASSTSISTRGPACACCVSPPSQLGCPSLAAPDRWVSLLRRLLLCSAAQRCCGGGSVRRFGCCAGGPLGRVDFLKDLSGLSTAEAQHAHACIGRVGAARQDGERWEVKSASIREAGCQEAQRPGSRFGRDLCRDGTVHYGPPGWALTMVLWPWLSGSSASTTPIAIPDHRYRLSTLALP